MYLGTYRLSSGCCRWLLTILLAYRGDGVMLICSMQILSRKLFQWCSGPKNVAVWPLAVMVCFRVTFGSVARRVRQQRRSGAIFVSTVLDYDPPHCTLLSCADLPLLISLRSLPESRDSFHLSLLLARYRPPTCTVRRAISDRLFSLHIWQDTLIAYVVLHTACESSHGDHHIISHPPPIRGGLSVHRIR